MRWFGVVAAIFGVGLALRSVLLLTGHGRPRRGPQPRFVIAGPYRRLRNPMFAGLVVALLGAAIAMQCLVTAAAALVLAAALHAWVVLVEEPRLTVRFGAAYQAYRRYVPRWCPWRRPRDPEDGGLEIR